MLKFERYMTVRNPGAFAVTLDGYHSGWSRCDGDECSKTDIDRALRLCEADARHRTCELLIRERELVWNGPLSYRPGNIFRMKRAKDLPVGMLWQGADAPREWGVAHFHFNGDILLYFKPSQTNGHCVGSIAMSSKWDGTFGVYCTDRGTASGDVELTGLGYGGGVGRATDENGQAVDIVIVPRSKFRDTVIKRVDQLSGG
ncbi:MAG: hypothetical protein AAF942_06205 [Pseudomonadota bacterium]